MSGNCATGIDAMAMMPASVMTMEMTKARRGRSTKMAEILASTSRAGSHHRALHRLPGPHLLHAVDDHLLAGLEAGVDHDVGVLVGTGGEAPHLHLVVVGDDQRVVAGLIHLQRGLGDHQALLLLPL